MDSHTLWNLVLQQIQEITGSKELCIDRKEIMIKKKIALRDFAWYTKRQKKKILRNVDSEETAYTFTCTLKESIKS